MGHPTPFPARDASQERPLSIAILCFMPDYGHLQPLLKIADALTNAGVEVKCYIAAECAPLMQRFSFPYASIDSTAALKKTRSMERMFAGGIFFNAVCLYAHYLLMYPRVGAAVGRAAAKLRQDLETQRPDLILCDSLWFVDLYARMAGAMQVPLVVNSLDGSLAYAQRDFVKIYGLSAAPLLRQRAVEWAAAISTAACTAFHRLRHLDRWARVRATRRATRQAFAAAFPVPEGASTTRQWIVVGTATLERSRLGIRAPQGGAARREFAPVQFRSRAVVPTALGEWLQTGGAGGVVYVSFGSAVDIDQAFATAVYEGLRRVPARVLWSLPQGQQHFVKHRPAAPNIRLESFVPQAEILAMRSVRCFVTQAGPHSVQEALFGATPMLCIPFFVDQAYNASVVVRLKAGLRLWRSEISPATIGTAVATILETPAFHDAARSLRDEIDRTEGGASVAHYLIGVAGARGAGSAAAGGAVVERGHDPARDGAPDVPSPQHHAVQAARGSEDRLGVPVS